MKVFVTLVALTCLVMAGPALAGDPDLVFYYSYDGLIEGNVVHDESDNMLDGEIIGDADQVDGGKRGKALEFQTTSYIDMDGFNVAPELVPTEEITLCAWAKCQKTGDHHAIFNARASDATWLIHPEFRSEGNFRWLLRSDGGATMFDLRAGTVVWDEWLHFAGVYDGKSGRLYINGELVGEQPAGGTIAGNWGQGARVGYNIDNARPFTGLMDDICMWRRALTQDEIKLVMAGGPEAIYDEAVSPVGNMATTWGELKASL